MSSSEDSGDEEDNRQAFITGENRKWRSHDIRLTTAIDNTGRFGRDEEKFEDRNLSFLALRIPYANIGILPFFAHLAELAWIVVLFLSVTNVGMPQVLGDWPAPVITGYMAFYGFLALIIGLLKPASDRAIPDPYPRKKSVRIAAEWNRQIYFAENDLVHMLKGFLLNMLLMLFWWTWFEIELGGNGTIVFSTNPEAYFSQLALSTIWLFINLLVFITTIFKNNLESNTIVIGVNVNRKKKE